MNSIMMIKNSRGLVEYCEWSHKDKELEGNNITVKILRSLRD